MAVTSNQIRWGFFSGSLLLVVLSLLLYQASLTVRAEFKEDRIIENMSAGTFFIVFIISATFLPKFNNIQHKRLFIIIFILGLAGFLDELSFGQRIFDFQVPFVLNFPLDAFHDLIPIYIKAVKAYLYLPIFLSIIFCLFAIYFIFFKKKITITHIFCSIKSNIAYFYFLLFVFYLSLAIACEEVVRYLFVDYEDFFFHPLFTYISPLEEILELNAALALLFCCLSICPSRKWNWGSLAFVAATAFVTAFLPRDGVMWKVHHDLGRRAVQQGDVDEGKRQHLAALAAAKRLGPKDHRVATSIGRLADLYVSQGQYAQAERLQEQLLANRERNLGRHHPKTLESRLNLAFIYQALGKQVLAQKQLLPPAEQGYVEAQYRLALMYLAGPADLRDYVRAYKWLNLSALLSPNGRVRVQGSELLSRVSKQMTSAQITQAQKEVREWWAKHRKK